jgi:hypothetical protein
MCSEIGTAFSHNRSQAGSSAAQSLTASFQIPVAYNYFFTLGTGAAIEGLDTIYFLNPRLLPTASQGKGKRK